ncbi:MAG TPA: hypothetical protein DHV85_10475, partial [Candidatus Accumulibacter sp.]|nr:hypothetical protein [Accumulibacter sp.]
MVDASDRGDVLERVAEKRFAQEGATLAQHGQHADLLGGGERARRSAGMQRQAMRPLARQVAHQPQPVGTRRQHLANVGPETPLGLRVPSAATIRRARNIGHEEEVEVGRWSATFSQPRISWLASRPLARMLSPVVSASAAAAAAAA